MKRNILAVTVAVSMLLPNVAGGAISSCVISALDTVAGMGTEVEAKSCEKNTTLEITIVSPDGDSSDLDLKTDASGNGHATVSSKILSRAGTYSLRSSAGIGRFEVLSDGPDAKKSFLSTSDDSIRSDGSDDVVITVTLRDRYGNPLEGRPVALLSNRAQDQINADASETDEYGEMSWTVSSKQNGLMTLTAYDILSTVAIAERADISVGSGFGNYSAALTGNERGGEFGVIDHFDVDIVGQENVSVNEDITISIAALDRNDQIVEDYVGTIVFTSSDPEALLPGGGETTFKPVELGMKRISLGLRFRTFGEHTLTVRDKDSTAQGKFTVMVERSSGGTQGDIQIYDPKKDARVSSPIILLQGKAPSLVNLKVVGGKEEVFGESDAEGVFRIEVELNENQTDHTLFIVSDNGRYQSESHHIVYDKNKPVIESITFTPEVGKSNSPATVVVKGETGLITMKVSIGSLVVDLTETDEGTYSGSFTAPTEAKTYDVKVTAADEPGNETEMLAKWTVEPKNVAIVGNVRVESLPNAVNLTWDQAQGDIEQYRIYVGEEPSNFSYGLDTGSKIGNARVNGLVPGRIYYFTITAISPEGDESEGSPVVAGSALGMSVSVTPGNESLLLQWEPPADTPLAGYILEYGIEPGQYPERRMVHGSLKAFTLRDLLNNVTYEVKLTPVIVAGQKLDELAAIVHGTPNGEGFGHGSVDPVPSLENGGSNGSTPSHGGAPLKPPPINTGSGIPSPIVWSLAAAVLVGTAFAFMRRRHQKIAIAFVREMDERYTR